MTRLVNWPDGPPLWGPDEEDSGDPVVDNDSEGEALTNLEVPPLVLGKPPLPPCAADAPTPEEEERCGLPVAVVRGRE